MTSDLLDRNPERADLFNEFWGAIGEGPADTLDGASAVTRVEM